MNTLSRNTKALFAAMALLLTAPVALADNAQLLADIEKDMKLIKQQHFTELQSDIRLEHSRELAFDGEVMEVAYPSVKAVHEEPQQSALTFELTARD